ncbi:alkaline phosphatase 4-like [Anthonomus grandis grandis]|uniref:alkaline phosphatase 4-like n=1 Tax=Anthonomus grandis grandis TaxID=2921223 RepID=UPI0021658233|nr:alkaline phosphatase 4-like [Anthonomus grandis grandis]
MGGLTTSTVARIYGKCESGRLAWETFDNLGVLKIYSANKLVPDSCSTATAMFTGIKANHKTAGVDWTVAVDDYAASRKKPAQVESFINWAQTAGKATGIFPEPLRHILVCRVCRFHHHHQGNTCHAQRSLRAHA